MQNIKSTLILVLTMAGLWVGGCAEYRKEQQLNAVARDWAMTIRASQIIPVYPLREDLEVGDVFLVRTPIERQQDEYRKKGFLPLDQQLTRLNFFGDAKDKFTDPFSRYYRGGFDTNHGQAEYTSVPDVWRSPLGWGDWRDAQGNQAGGMGVIAWSRAPGAYFPNYTFKVTSGTGIGAAFPIQSVPVALSLMNAQSATGSVQISQAYTYGLGKDEVQDQVDQWACRSKQSLSNLRSSSAGGSVPVYVRVITRVYLAGAINVTLTNDRAFTAGVQAGVGPTQEEVDENLRKFEARTMSAGEAATKNPVGANAASSNGDDNTSTSSPVAPGRAGDSSNAGGVADKATTVPAGGAFRINIASARTVSAQETFPRPLVIGFLALDYPVRDDGTLGEPMATREHVEKLVQSLDAVHFSSAENELDILTTEIEACNVSRAEKWLLAASDELGIRKEYNRALAGAAAPSSARDLHLIFHTVVTQQEVCVDRQVKALRAGRPR